MVHQGTNLRKIHVQHEGRNIRFFSIDFTSSEHMVVYNYLYPTDPITLAGKKLAAG